MKFSNTIGKTEERPERCPVCCSTDITEANEVYDEIVPKGSMTCNDCDHTWLLEK